VLVCSDTCSLNGLANSTADWTAEGAKLAQDQSVHLYLCMLIHDLTQKYGPVVREARVTGVLDQAFDVVIVSMCVWD
jgi:hypothetical protein